MFFLVTHTWEEGNEEQANFSLIRLFRNASYGKIGNPWPKLFNSWEDPKSPTVYSLFEASSKEQLTELLESIEDVQSTMLNVRQLYPPHVDTYDKFDLQRRNPWKKPN
jgi:hypothetical protein